MMRSAAVRLLACAVAVAALGACRGARETEEDAHVPLAGRDCARARGDSAQAVCLALNEVERIDSTSAEAYALQRYGDTICVHTWPDRKRYPTIVDGEGAVAVFKGRVVGAVVDDSVRCPGR